MSEKEYLLSKISEVAGQINRHKAQKDGIFPESHHHSHHASRYSPYTYGSNPRGMYRGSRGLRGRGRGGRVAAHRNRTLILNNTNSTKAESSNSPAEGSPQLASDTQSGDGSVVAPTPSGQQWVAKRARHMQLINSAVYEDQTKARLKAIEATRIEKLKRKSDRQKLKLQQFLRTSTYSAPSQNSTHYINIGDSKYVVSSGGNKLIRMQDDTKPATATPRRAVIGGVSFVRSKNGNLWRSGLIEARRQSTKKVDRPCKYFTLTGQCQRGMSCPYVHDPNKVAICPRFLKDGECPQGAACDLSHDPTPHRVPECLHFLRGNCSNPNCRYAHIRVNPAAPICRPFAIEGYCEKGADCTDRHLHECPDFDETGVCKNKRCKLPHVERAGRRRLAAEKANENGKKTELDEEESDYSSDEDGDAIDSEDIDSDALSEDEDNAFWESDSKGSEGQDLSQQKDFIKF